MKRCFIFFSFLLIKFSLQSQSTSFINYVDTLTSNYFKGRGYVANGHGKAAAFLSNEYREIGLDSLSKKSYLQRFKIDVNTFPKKVALKINGKKLIPGEDFIVEPYSGSAVGVYNVSSVNLNNWKSYLSVDERSIRNFLILNVSEVANKDTLSRYNEIKNILNKHYPILWVSSKKLQWSVAEFYNLFPVINIKSDVIKEPINTLNIEVENEFKKSLETQNLVGKLKGKRKKTIIISAHYDHLGMMGELMFPGANDNASGVSLLLNLASYYSKKKPKYNLVFICFGAEEVGLLGSKYFVNNPLINLDNVKLLVNLDIVGTGEDGIAIVNAFEQEKATKIIGKINEKVKYFPKIKLRGQAPNSDHFWFSKKNVPALFIYTMGGIKAYHDPLDIAKTLPLNKVDELQSLIIKLVSSL